MSLKIVDLIFFLRVPSCSHYKTPKNFLKGRFLDIQVGHPESNFSRVAVLMYPCVGQLGRSLSPSPQVIKNDCSWIMPHLDTFG